MLVHLDIDIPKKALDDIVEDLKPGSTIWTC